MFALKNTWKDTGGLASASQLVNRTFSPVIGNDMGTVPRQERRLTITSVIERASFKRSKDMKFSAVKRRRKTVKKKFKGPKKS